MMSVESNGLPLESVPLSGLGDLYSQDFDAVLGIDGQATDQRFPAGWAFSDDGVFFDDATTTKFPVGPNFASDSTFNAGAENNSDRALAIGVASTNDQPMLQLLGHVTESDATSLQLSFDIEAWDARQLGSLPVDLADVPGEAAFKVIVEVDSGEGFTEALNFGTVTTGAVLELPDGDHLDGNVSPNRVSFDSGIQPVALANGSTLRLRWTADNEAQTRGWVFGLDNVALSLFSATSAAGDYNGDGALDVNDVDSLVGEIVSGRNNILFDLTGDGAVDKGDLTAWLSVAAEHNGFNQAYLPGDSNLDGSVDSADLNNLALSWRQDATRWSAGDFTADGSVSPLDLNELALNWRQSIAIAASTASLVPEPSNIAMLLGGLVLLRIRRRRRR
jgi:hypothetical protein